MATKQKRRRKRKTLVELAAFAVGSRIRIDALTIFNERVASVNQVAEEIGEGLQLVGHHVKELVETGCLELVKTKERGGAVEHFYRAVRRPELSDEEWWALDDSDRREISTAGLRNLFAEGLASIQTGKMSADRRMSIWWKASQLDDQGREEAHREQAEHIDRLQEIEARSIARMVEAGEGEDKQAASTVVAVLGFTRSRSGQPAAELPSQSDS